MLASASRLGASGWDRNSPAFGRDDADALLSPCTCRYFAHDAPGSARSGCARTQHCQAGHPHCDCSGSSHGRQPWGRTRRADDVRRCPEVHREASCQCRRSPSSAQDRSQGPLRRLQSCRHVRGRHAADRPRCRAGTLPERFRQGDRKAGFREPLKRDRGPWRRLGLRASAAKPGACVCRRGSGPRACSRRSCAGCCRR